MELEAIYDRAMACAMIQEPDGGTRVEQRRFGAFKRDRQALAQRAATLVPDEVVMEGKHLLEESLCCARGHEAPRQGYGCAACKNGPGRKTDVTDVQCNRACAAPLTVLAKQSCPVRGRRCVRRCNRETARASWAGVSAALPGWLVLAGLIAQVRVHRADHGPLDDGFAEGVDQVLDRHG